MPVFSTEVSEILTAAGANAFTTLLGLKFADTLGHRGRLLSLVVTGGGGAPQDEQMAVRYTVGDNSADGTFTAVNVNTIAKQDELSVASLVAAIGKTYTVEPTAKGTEVHALGGLNMRGILSLDWSHMPEKAPRWNRNQTLCIEGAPSQAVAMKVNIAIRWEEFRIPA